MVGGGYPYGLNGCAFEFGDDDLTLKSEELLPAIP